MDFLELIQRRRSVRRYLDDTVEEKLLMRVLDAGRLAPSACNNQPWIFIVVREKGAKLKLSTVYNREWFYSSPIIIAICCNHNESWHRKDGKDYGDVDIAIAMDHMTLAAAEVGLGTCWIGNFNESEARNVLCLPAHLDPVVITPLGFPHDANKDVEKNRKSLKDIVYYECFGNNQSQKIIS